MKGKSRGKKRTKPSSQEGGSIGAILQGVAKVALPLLSQLFSGDGRSNKPHRRPKK